MSIDPRAFSAKPIDSTDPLPFVSRRALRRVKDWMPPPVACPGCGEPVKLVNNSVIYRGRSYGDWPYAYDCRPCDMFVGLHPETDLPLGTMADKELREARKEAKSIWIAIQKAEGWSRSKAYQWLAGKMGVPANECHFGYFDLDRARLAFKVFDEYLLGVEVYS